MLTMNLQAHGLRCMNAYVEEYISPTPFIVFLCCHFLLGPLALLERFDLSTFLKTVYAMWCFLSPSIVLAVVYLVSKICQRAILVNPKKVGCLLRVFANISRTVWNFRLLFSAFYRDWWGLHNRCKKTGGCRWKFSARWRQNVFIGVCLTSGVTLKKLWGLSEFM